MGATIYRGLDFLIGEAPPEDTWKSPARLISTIGTGIWISAVVLYWIAAYWGNLAGANFMHVAILIALAVLPVIRLEFINYTGK